MDSIMDIAKRYNLIVIEDAAQGILATYQGRQLGSIGHMAAYSFHETKNVISGEGGALLVNDKRFLERAEIIREKGTNRTQFFRGQSDKYSWMDIGSSYLPGEVTAAFLWAQLRKAEFITQKRQDVWNFYHDTLVSLESAGQVRRPAIPANCQHNSHMYYILLPSLHLRTQAIDRLKENNIHAVFHYVPLHSSHAGIKFGKKSGDMTNTDELASRIMRLPLWISDDMNHVFKSIPIIERVLKDLR
jgi:dTDP-4-amino-4,6-dideoxygalactose transaminase